MYIRSNRTAQQYLIRKKVKSGRNTWYRVFCLRALFFYFILLYVETFKFVSFLKTFYISKNGLRHSRRESDPAGLGSPESGLSVGVDKGGRERGGGWAVALRRQDFKVAFKCNKTVLKVKSGPLCSINPWRAGSLIADLNVKRWYPERKRWAEGIRRRLYFNFVLYIIIYI